jgi:cation transport ATPase
MKILDRRTVAEIQAEFHTKFPYLKLEFYNQPHEVGEGLQLKSLIDRTKTIRSVRTIIYAGGRQTGEAIEVTLTKKVSQSYLTQLWNDDAFTKPTSDFNLMIDKVGQTFTIGILIVATVTGIYWLINDASLAMNAFTAVLIIACPCALALNIPFALGNTLRILGKNKFYLKNTDVLERMQEITDLVFDKTGTLTSTSNNQLIYEGTDLTDEERVLIKTLAAQSSHPISQEICRQPTDGKRQTGLNNLNTSTHQPPSSRDRHIQRIGWTWNFGYN